MPGPRFLKCLASGLLPPIRGNFSFPSEQRTLKINLYYIQPLAKSDKKYPILVGAGVVHGLCPLVVWVWLNLHGGCYSFSSIYKLCSLLVMENYLHFDSSSLASGPTLNIVCFDHMVFFCHYTNCYNDNSYE